MALKLHQAVRHLLTANPQSEKQWMHLQKTGASDETLLREIKRNIGKSIAEYVGPNGSYFCHVGKHISLYNNRINHWGKKKPSGKFRFYDKDSDSCELKPDLYGIAFVKYARKVLGIPDIDCGEQLELFERPKHENKIEPDYS